ncbi:hypothetical protein NP493_1890g00009, partial [Ridgeia piscesae]
NWAFSDVRQGRVLTKVPDSSSQALTCAQFHPDGLIFGTGTKDSVIKIWDLKERTNVANFQGHSGAITSISFSENGTLTPGSVSVSGLLDTWKCEVRDFGHLGSVSGLWTPGNVRSLCFDHSGTYLAVAGTDVRVYLCKQWQELKVFNDHTALATGVRFGQNGTFVASTSMDRSLKIFGL